MILSMLFKPIPSKWLLRHMTPVLDYFDYEQIIETSPIDCRKDMLENGKNFIIAVQPHGVIPFVSICAAVYAPPEFQCDLQTAVASVLLHTPILKHVMGIFGLIDASKHNLKRVLKKPGVAGSLVIYVGGIAELFMSCPEEERLFLSQRKGFIKLALTEGVDIVPIYLFGNTGVLTVLKTGLLATLSRKLQVSLTYFWGKFHLPIPRDDKVRTIIMALTCV
jgi:1-acyl-sn-glycerol-3-phosphate acyltransferase